MGRPGRAVSAYFAYMMGVSNQLALTHVPEVAPRNDTLAGGFAAVCLPELLSFLAPFLGRLGLCGWGYRRVQQAGETAGGRRGPAPPCPWSQ